MTDAELAAERLTALLDAEREIERLRAQRVLSNEDFARSFDMGLAAGERRERAAVVAWLHRPGPLDERGPEEVERLRAEVSYLRACVPPTRPTDYGHEVWTAALRAEVAAERAAVVAFLRASVSPGFADDLYDGVRWRADEIENGEHRREGGA